MNKIRILEGQLVESKKIQGELNGELEYIKKSVSMLNSDSSKLD